MPTKKSSRKQKTRRQSIFSFSKKNMLIMALIFGLVGGTIILRSYAASRSYSRLDCNYANLYQGYSSAQSCYNHSAEANTTRLYVALIGRQPDTGSLKYWADVYSSYTVNPQTSLVNKMLFTTEAKTKFVNLPSTSARVTYLYNTLLKRAPDPSGARYWTARFAKDNNWGVTVAAFANTAESIKTTQKTVDSAFFFLPATWRPVGLPNVPIVPNCATTGVCNKGAAVVHPRGTYSTWNWNPPANGFVSLQHNLTINSNQPTAFYFWSHQFKFINGDGGYIGLQSNGSRVADKSIGKTAVFSVFSSGIAATPGVCSVEQAGFDGYNTSGSSCRIAYEWKTGHTYTLKTVLDGADARGTWWAGYVIDFSARSTTLIGKIETPPSWKGFGDWSVMWTENFYSTASTCNAIPYSNVTFSAPVANGNVAPYNSSQSQSPPSSTPCNNSRITPIGNAVIQEIGNPV